MVNVIVLYHLEGCMLAERNFGSPGEPKVKKVRYIFYILSDSVILYSFFPKIAKNSPHFFNTENEQSVENKMFIEVHRLQALDFNALY